MEPTKKQLSEVSMIFANCLAIIYEEVGLDFPLEFDSDVEAARIIAAFRGGK